MEYAGVVEKLRNEKIEVENGFTRRLAA